MLSRITEEVKRMKKWIIHMRHSRTETLWNVIEKKKIYWTGNYKSSTRITFDLHFIINNFSLAARSKKKTERFVIWQDPLYK